MAAVNQPKYSKREVSQKFNLKQLLGYEPSERQKDLFFELAVNKMVQRTAQGNDINGKKFTQYSKEYAQTKGVSRSAVDLILKGDMLDSNKKETKQKNMLKIKVKEGVETLKSYNHNVGDKLPTRTYFGFKNEKDLSDVIDEVDSRKTAETSSPGVLLRDLALLRQTINETVDVNFTGFDDGES